MAILIGIAYRYHERNVAIFVEAVYTARIEICNSPNSSTLDEGLGAKAMGYFHVDNGVASSWMEQSK